MEREQTGIKYVVTMLAVLAALVCMSARAEAFSWSLGLNEIPFVANEFGLEPNHETITANGVNGGLPSGSLQFLQFSAVYPDIHDVPYNPTTDSPHHFDNGQISQGNTYVESMWGVVTQDLARVKSDRLGGILPPAVALTDYLQTLHDFGKLLHANQDFYSHSNYVEIWSAGTADPNAVPVWDRALTANGVTIISGTYGGYVDPSLPTHEALNKDMSTSPEGSQPWRPGASATNFQVAYDLAVRQTALDYQRFLNISVSDPYTGADFVHDLSDPTLAAGFSAFLSAFNPSNAGAWSTLDPSAAVPEPSSWILVVCGLVAWIALRRPFNTTHD